MTMLAPQVNPSMPLPVHPPAARVSWRGMVTGCAIAVWVVALLLISAVGTAKQFWGVLIGGFAFALFDYGWNARWLDIDADGARVPEELPCVKCSHHFPVDLLTAKDGLHCPLCLDRAELAGVA